SLANGLDQIGIRVRGEVLERRGLAVLLAHEEHRNERRKDDRGRGEAQLRGRDDGGETLAAHAVADLVMVLREDDELRAVARARPRAVFSLAERRVLSDVEVAGGEDMREVADLAEARVVAVLLAGEEDVQRVVEVVAPLRVEAEAEARGGGDDARVVEIALR